MCSKSTSDLTFSVPKDTVILHCIERGKTAPSLSPFVLKLETFLRMADIPYEIDTKKPFGPSGKTPWITFNKKDMTDSQLIIDYLSKHFNINLWGNATEEQKALARITRISLEEHFFWGMVRWRFVEGIETIPQLMNISSVKFTAMKLVFPGRIKKTLFAQGLGRHSIEDLNKLTGDDLRNVSALIGQKSFILGDEPCEADCAIFGIIAQALWASPGSPFNQIVHNDEILKGYCERMKRRFWQDWDSLLFVQTRRK